MSWTLVYTHQARRDAKKVSRSGLRPQAQKLLEILSKNPYQTPPPYEKLVGDLAGACSRRINIQLVSSTKFWTTSRLSRSSEGGHTMNKTREPPLVAYHCLSAPFLNRGCAWIPGQPPAATEHAALSVRECTQTGRINGPSGPPLSRRTLLGFVA